MPGLPCLPVDVPLDQKQVEGNQKDRGPDGLFLTHQKNLGIWKFIDRGEQRSLRIKGPLRYVEVEDA